ncbi:N-6 DNA methylase [Limibaculum sp. M0105]|uniref:site-specific DNA-methyltransferase (adenine-specific) n=1 Tax=Thermohalobaculum xanthum TaxID=2753746 RepID=A0A8J7M744_9RHOB|nr:N-6 DNA methylase [Thermohalobaculum xanthum]MBK0399821.1 N-6 DNA methylase [Thermohalobaculum xanthum]
MPLTPDLRRSIDQIRDYLYAGGYPNPAQNAEQLSFLIFFYMFEATDAARVRGAKRPGAAPYASAFEGDWQLRNPLNARDRGAETVPKDLLRWSSWANALNGERLVSWVREEVFPFYAEIAAQGVTNFMEGARLVLDEPTVLSQTLTRVSELHLEQMDADTKGDLFEHVLRQIKQAGELGQFRTPRHVIRTIVHLVDPRLGETVYDPAAGTAGFLVAAYDHIRLVNSSPDAIEEAVVDGKPMQRGAGDRLSREAARQLHEATFYGNDVDPQMVRLATMNLSLRGLDRVRILRRDALTRTLDRQQKIEMGLPPEGFDVVLANPPFSGRLDKDRIVDDVKVGTTTQTELLFLQYMLNQLKPGGRCGVVVPEGVLFGSTGAHKELRRKLIENNTVEAVLSLPGGVFQPYSGVKTSILVFRKGGETGRVMFLHADNDGYKLDANHDQPIEADDLPGLVAAFNSREELWEDWQARDQEAEWTENWWFADAETIRAADFNLSAGRHRPQSRAQVQHRDPQEILDELRAIERELMEELDELADAVRETVA